MYLPKCHDKNKDCFANILDDRCDCLKTTKFPNNVCPFYKPADEVDREEIEEAVREYTLR